LLAIAVSQPTTILATLPYREQALLPQDLCRLLLTDRH
jgi:hypothetical protein